MILKPCNPQQVRNQLSFTLLYIVHPCERILWASSFIFRVKSSVVRLAGKQNTWQRPYWVLSEQVVYRQNSKRTILQENVICRFWLSSWIQPRDRKQKFKALPLSEPAYLAWFVMYIVKSIYLPPTSPFIAAAAPAPLSRPPWGPLLLSYKYLCQSKTWVLCRTDWAAFVSCMPGTSWSADQWDCYHGEALAGWRLEGLISASLSG